MPDGQIAKITLLRHGETGGNPGYRGITDDALNAAGWTQMWSAVTDAVQWKSVITSPLRRCADFAHAFAERHSLPVTVDERLREMNFGTWEGRSTNELWQTEREALAHFWENPWLNGPPGGESLADLRERVLAAWHDIVRRQHASLVVTHGGPIRILWCHLHRRPFDKAFDIDVPHAAMYQLPARFDSLEPEKARP